MKSAEWRETKDKIALSKKYIESYADYNKDGEVNSMDLTAVRKHIIGDETLEIGELSNDCITTNDVYAAAMIGNVAGTSVLFENCYVNNNEFAIPVNKLDAAGFTVDSYGTSKNDSSDGFAGSSDHLLHIGKREKGD